MVFPRGWARADTPGEQACVFLTPEPSPDFRALGLCGLVGNCVTPLAAAPLELGSSSAASPSRHPWNADQSHWTEWWCCRCARVCGCVVCLCACVCVPVCGVHMTADMGRRLQGLRASPLPLDPAGALFPLDGQLQGDGGGWRPSWRCSGLPSP